MTQIAPPDDRLIRFRTPRDVVATVPRLLGYRPRRSIVLLNQHEGGRLSTMRVDLPDAAAPRVEKRFATTLAGMVSKAPGVRKILLVVFADGPFDAGGDVPRASLVRPLISRLVASGYDVHDALCVADDAWGAYDGADAGIPHALDEMLEPAPGGLRGELPTDDLDAFASVPTAGALARRAFDRALDRALGDHAVMRPVQSASAALELDLETADSDALAAVFAPLLFPELRDAALYTWAWGEQRGLALLAEAVRIEAGEVGPEDDSIALDLMGLRPTDRPSHERLSRAIEVMSRVAALAPDDVAHVAFTVLAWLHWAQGAGSVAGRLVDRALALDRDYGLADLLAMVLGRGGLPEWVYEPPEG
ncbi:MAG: DUF4192 domain-containing protein [Microbacteriaceae bacterium]|nr:DUF4192 domain-containing protein [Microbacteriaceae bacterium]MCL2795489.1 DUF4192 domain-containing protein [Microbacteriaceae bacterium]